MVTFKPRASRIAARDAEAMPLPKEDTTPPVMKTNFVINTPNNVEMVARSPISKHAVELIPIVSVFALLFNP